MANFSKTHLTILQTPFGARSVYDSVCHCNRCGMCASACPSYQQTRQEPFSPRGRNQTLRLILQGKIKAKHEHKLLKEIIGSCMLCGRCVQYCPGKIPTPEHVLELRRRTGISLLPSTLFYLLRLRQTAPEVFSLLMKLGLISRRIGLLHVLACVPGFAWMKHALEILPRKARRSAVSSVKDPTLIYLPSLEAEFFMPDLFEQTYRLLSEKSCVEVWQNIPSGLFEYVYGDIRNARKLVRKLIIKHAAAGDGKLPIVTDSIEVYNFLTQAVQLFAGFQTFEQKAANFASCVCYVTDFLPQQLAPQKLFPSPIQLFPSAAFLQETSPQLKARQILRTLFKKNFVECEYRDGTIPPLGYGFIEHTRASAFSLLAVQTMAAHQIQTVFVLSGLTALELGFYIRKFYPTAQVRHLIELNG